ncbi:SDR family NAD(P)-dependent oxidoreductase [Gracilibacillus kekensis]|uniref:UDP-glucuronate 4-epimerase n=1 Tax=Gracilibacillus kekensis TaxID=1027249 RepID=A0A1M7JZV6_9BACI|nr:SDR family NAD(P)-dependent oxidoreductase [Gracilibacillus kekensis]SHM58518.1 UDP-glucuronate 4-epimerase [Gracilibacillus kekensis]
MNNPNKSVYLVTGAAGFIGYHLSKRLLEQGAKVVGVDNLNDYYDVTLKETRLSSLQIHNNFTFIQADISDKRKVESIFVEYRPHVVVNLAAQAGVRYSIENPDVYMQSNVIGFYNILEACRHYPVDHLIYASSSSVYGANKKVPFEETDSVDQQISLYAATKKSNELTAYTYSHLYGIPTTGLRFFTVYGPWGRPDMSYYIFANKYFAGEPIKIYNNGDFEHDLYRDFIYIDDLIEGIVRVIPRIPNSRVPHDLFNIGNNNPQKLMEFITMLEKALSNTLGRDVEFLKEYEPVKPGDLPETYASTERLHKEVGFKPEKSIEEGLQHFADWYVEYHNLR